MAKVIRFGKWRRVDKIQFTGMDVMTLSDGEIQVLQTAYMHKVCPMSIDKRRKTEPDAPSTPKERTALRALLGALQ